MTVDQFADWRKALKGEVVNFNQDHPTPGYWRTRQVKGGPLMPVAIWQDDDGINVQCDGKDVPYERVWPWAAKQPVTYEAFTVRTTTGQWPDIDPVAAQQHEANRESIGGNNPPADPLTLLKEQIDSAKAGATAYAIIQDDETLAKAQTLRSRLLELSKESDDKRKAEKEPHKIASDAVDDKWMPLVKLAKGCADGIRAAMEVFESAKLAKRRAEEAKLAEAERDRQAVIAKATAAAAAAGKAPPPPPPPTPQTPMFAYAPIKGAAGRAASSKPKLIAKRLMNLDECFAYFRLSAEVSELFMVLAQRELDGGKKEVPGIMVEEIAVVK